MAIFVIVKCVTSSFGSQHWGHILLSVNIQIFHAYTPQLYQVLHDCINASIGFGVYLFHEANSYLVGIPPILLHA